MDYHSVRVYAVLFIVRCVWGFDMRKNANFTPAEFLTVGEKQLIYKQWEGFINWLASGERSDETMGTDGGEIDPKGYRLFTDNVYKHLSLHCGFIAHYNRAGFFSTYFVSGEDTETFFNNLVRDGGYGDTQDLTTAMIAYYQAKKDLIINKTSNDIDDRLSLIEECVKRANTDPVFARQFLHKINLW